MTATRPDLSAPVNLLSQYTMPAKMLETLAMINAIVEIQNPLPRKTMSRKGDMNISASRSDTFL